MIILIIVISLIKVITTLITVPVKWSNMDLEEQLFKDLVNNGYVVLKDCTICDFRDGSAVEKINGSSIWNQGSQKIVFFNQNVQHNIIMNMTVFM